MQKPANADINLSIIFTGIRENISVNISGKFCPLMLELKAAETVVLTGKAELDKIIDAINPPNMLITRQRANDNNIRTISLSIIMLSRLLLCQAGSGSHAPGLKFNSRGKRRINSQTTSAVAALQMENR